MIRATANSMTDRERRTMNRRLKILALILLAIVVLGVSAGLWLYRTVERSLPVLAGEVEGPGLDGARRRGAGRDRCSHHER